MHLLHDVYLGYKDDLDSHLGCNTQIMWVGSILIPLLLSMSSLTGVLASTRSLPIYPKFQCQIEFHQKMLFICYTLKNYNGYTFSVELYYAFLLSIQDAWQYVIHLLWNPLCTPPSPLFLLSNPRAIPTWVICILLSILSSSLGRKIHYTKGFSVK